MGNELVSTQHGPEQGLAVKGSEAVAEVQAAAVLAMQNPRDELEAWERVAQSCKRPGFADGAEYSYTRGDSHVSGPSVKLAREMARCWRNIRYGIRVLDMTREEVQVEGWAWDLETNARVSSEARFARRVQRRRGEETVWVEADERNLRELVNKHGAIAVRNAILQLLPPDMVDAALKLARKTMAGAVDEKLEQNREEVLGKVMAAWQSYDVTTPMLEKYLGKLVGDWTGEDVAKLRAAYESVRDGNSDPAEYFDMSGERKGAAQQELEEAASGKKKGKKKSAKKAEQADLMEGDGDG